MINIIISQDKTYEEHDSRVMTADQIKVKRPKRYKVLMHNDDYTTMEFVIEVLQIIFQKNKDQAEEIMLKIHNEGTAICGIYTYEIAETKIKQVEDKAKAREFPLKCSIEPE